MALLEPLIDTIIVCTMTALVIVVTGAYMSVDAVTGAEFGRQAVHRLDKNGAGLTSKAFETTFSVVPLRAVAWRWCCSPSRP